jgi:hypothetical protein
MSNKRKPHSAETKEKMRLSRLKYYSSHPEVIESIRIRQSGRKLPDEQKKKIGESVKVFFNAHPEIRMLSGKSCRGKHKTDVTKERISRAKIEYYKTNKHIPWNKGKKCPQLKGSNNGMWEGGINDFSRFIRSSIKNKQWIIDCLSRDRFMCNECGKVGGDLNVHHIKRFSVLLKEAQKYFPWMNSYDAAMSYLPLWDITNGITLCVTCHKAKHKKANN